MLTGLTFYVWLGGNLIGDGRRASKINAQDRISRTAFYDASDIEMILPELIVRRCDGFTAQFNTCKGIETFE